MVALVVKEGFSLPSNKKDIKGKFIKDNQFDTPESYKTPEKKNFENTSFSNFIAIPTQESSSNFHLPSPYWGLSCPSLEGDNFPLINGDSLSSYSHYAESNCCNKKQKRYFIKTDEMLYHHEMQDIYSSFSDFTISLSKMPFRYPPKLSSFFKNDNENGILQQIIKLPPHTNYSMDSRYYSILVNLLIPFTKSYKDTSIDTAFIALGIIVQFPNMDISILLICSLMISFKFQEEEDLTIEEIQLFLQQRLKSFKMFDGIKKFISTEFFIFSNLSISLNTIIRPTTLAFKILDYIDLHIMNLGPGVKMAIGEEFQRNLLYINQFKEKSILSLIIGTLSISLSQKIRGHWHEILNECISF